MKLTYFDLRCRAEPIRFMLAAAGVKFEDYRFSYAEWPKIKPGMPWGQVPVLETDDGTVLAESIAICRYLARKYGLAGSTELENAKCDEYVDAFYDIFLAWIDVAWYLKGEVKAEKQKKFEDVTSVAFFSKLNSIIKANGGTFLVGKGLTWADIFIGCTLDDMVITTKPDLLQNYPEVLRMRSAVFSHPGIKTWVDKRPPEDLLAMINSEME